MAIWPSPLEDMGLISMAPQTTAELGQIPIRVGAFGIASDHWVKNYFVTCKLHCLFKEITLLWAEAHRFRI